VTFSHYGCYTALLDHLLGPSGWIEHARESWIRLLGSWVPYPLQNNIHRLPPTERAMCIEGLVEAALNGSGRRFANFEEFIRRTFGSGISDLFMLPYNNKVWAYPATELDAGWVLERVSVPDPVRAVRAMALGVDDVDWGPNNKFRFPRRNGTGAIWDRLVQGLPREKLVTGCEVVAVDVAGKKVRLSDGGEMGYEAMISTMPLDELARMSGREDWIASTSELKHSSLFVVGLGLEGGPPSALRAKCWMYFPEANCPFYRVTHFSLYSPNNVDDIDAHWSILCEISESERRPVDAASVVDETIRGLVVAGLIDSVDQVFHTWLHRVEHAYPTPTLGRDRTITRLLMELYKADILSRGRFGAWRYEVGNMDHCFMQGVEAAGHLLHGSPELTVWDPALVNTPHPVLGWDRMR
jgi:protoporphyrinogen oxidase